MSQRPTALRVGIVGRRGGSTAAGLRAAGAEVAAVCELDVDALQRMGDNLEVPPAMRFARFDDLLSSGVDAVVVGTPMHLHAPQCIAAMEAGKHALSEVTAAISIDQCRDLLRAVRRAEPRGIRYMMAENYCYSRQNVLIRALVARGAFGDPYYAEGEYLHDVKNLHHNADGSPTWRAHWQVGVNGCTYPTHSLGPIMQWLGHEPIDSVTCLGSGVHTDPEHVIEDSIVMLCKLNSGRLARVRLDMMSNRPHAMNNYTLQGTEGAYESARAPGESDRIWLQTMGERRWHELAEMFGELPSWYRDAQASAERTGHGGGDFFTAWAFVRACLGLESVAIPIEDALTWTLAGLCSQASIARGGAPVAVPTIQTLEGEQAVRTGGSNVTTAVATSSNRPPRQPQLVMRRPASLGRPEVPTPVGYGVRVAAAEDAPGLAHVLSLAFGEWTVDRVRSVLLEAPDVRATYVVCDPEGRVVACASDRRVPETFPGACYLHFVAVDPAHGRRGLGRVVSAAAIGHAWDERDCDAVLETDDHRLPAVSIYLRLGFAPEYTHASHTGRWAAVFRALMEWRR